MRRSRIHTLILALTLTLILSLSLITHCQPLIYPNFLTNFDHYDGCAIKIKIHAVSVSFSLCVSLFRFALSLSPFFGPGITRSLTERRVGHNKRCRCPLTLRSRKKMLSETSVQAQDLEMGDEVVTRVDQELI